MYESHLRGHVSILLWRMLPGIESNVTHVQDRISHGIQIGSHQDWFIEAHCFLLCFLTCTLSHLTSVLLQATGIQSWCTGNKERERKGADKVHNLLSSRFKKSFERIPIALVNVGTTVNQWWSDPQLYFFPLKALNTKVLRAPGIHFADKCLRKQV